MLLVVAETTILSYHARFALSTTSFKKFSSTSLPLRSRSPLPRNALRRFAPSEHILIYQLYSPSSTTFFTCFLSLSFVRFLSPFIPLLYLLIRFIRPFLPLPSFSFFCLYLYLINKKSHQQADSFFYLCQRWPCGVSSTNIPTSFN